MIDRIIRAGNFFGDTMTDLIVATRISTDIENGRKPEAADLKFLGL